MTKQEFRQYLNDTEGFDTIGKGPNNRMKPKKRLYGDYLWFQDRIMFDVLYNEYIKKG